MKLSSASIFLPLLAIAVAMPMLHAARVATGEQALESAKASGQDILVFYRGSQWCKPGEVLNKGAWARPEFDAATGNAVLVDIDQPDNPSEEQGKAFKAAHKRILDAYRPWDCPALALFDSKGRLVAKDEGLAPGLTAAQLAARAQALAKVRTQRDQAWAAAEKGGSDKAKAAALGRGLMCMEFPIARKYGDEIKRIKALDPSDATGYVSVFEYNSLAMTDSKLLPLNRRGNERKDNHAEVIAEIDKLVANPVRPTWQKQELLAMKSAAYEFWGDHEKERRKTLEALIALDPKSDTALGARRLLEPDHKKQW